MNARVSNAVFAVALVLTATSVFAQQGPQANPGIRSNSIYLEVAGNAGDGSLNYERLVGKRTVVRVGYGSSLESYGSCFGIGFISACEGERESTTIPVMVSRLIGVGTMTELGLGVAFGRATDSYTPLMGEPVSTDESFTALTATVGARFQGPGMGLIRIGFTPSYTLSGGASEAKKFKARFGLSFGLAF